MGGSNRLLWTVLATAALLVGSAAPMAAQAKVKQKYYVVTGDRAVTVTRTVLVRRGFRVVRIERVGPNRVVYYRPARGKGPLRRMVIRAVRDRVLFEDADPDVLIDIDVDLNR